MYIVVDEHRYEQLKAMDVDIELFTTNREEGFIEIVKKNELYGALSEEEHATGIILSGWVNHPSYRFQNRVRVILFFI